LPITASPLSSPPSHSHHPTTITLSLSFPPNLRPSPDTQKLPTSPLPHAPGAVFAQINLVFFFLVFEYVHLVFFFFFFFFFFFLVQIYGGGFGILIVKIQLKVSATGFGVVVWDVFDLWVQ
ncbi:unnamed protein product, partial [Prunus brigantina]